MSDLIDDANETAELFLRAALLNKQQSPILNATGVGFCLHCEKDLAPERRWCDAACRDAWQRENPA